MRLKRRVAVAAAAGLLVTTVAIATMHVMSDRQAKAVKSPALREMPLDASWAVAYGSIGELKRNTDLGVSGTIVRVIRQTTNPQHLMSRDYAFAVTRILHAKSGVDVEEGQEITIHQTGGIADGVRQEIVDDPLFKDHEKAVLFLRQDGPSDFHVVGPTGRFKIDATNQVTRFNDEGVPFEGTASDIADVPAS